jgi:hypothetical protein
MKVRYEPALPDLSYCVQAPLLLDLEGVGRFWAERWSLDGIVLPSGAPAFEGPALITIPYQNFGITFRAGLRYEGGKDRLTFAELGQREADVLRHFYRELVTGRASSIDRMIYSMDIPVDLVPMSQTKADIAAEPRRGPSRVWRTLSAVCLYAAFAAIAYQPIIAPLLAELRADFSGSEQAGF